jgi:hypothetical protein
VAKFSERRIRKHWRCKYAVKRSFSEGDEVCQVQVSGRDEVVMEEEAWFQY